MTKKAKDKDRSQNDLIIELEKLRNELIDLKLKGHAIDSYLYGIAISDLESNIHYVNKSWLQMNGYNDLIEVKDKSALDFFKYPEQAQKALKNLTLTGSWNGVLDAKRKNGSTYDLKLTANIINNENGEPVSIVASGVDITEQRKSEKKLIDSEKKYKSVVENMIDGYYRADKEGNLIMVSPSVEKTLGFDKSEILNKKVSSFYANPKDREKFISEIKKKGSVENYPAEFIRKEKPNIFIKTNSRIYYDDKGDYAGIEGTFRDVTKHKRAEQKLIESERRLKAFSEVVNEAIFFSDKGVCIEANETAMKIFGYSREESIGKFATDIIAPENQELVKKNVISNYDKPYDVIAMRKDGSTFNAEIIGRLFNYQGKKIRVTSFKDITERKKAEEKLLKLYAAVQQSPSVITITDLKGNIEYVNPRFTELTGYSLDEAIGQNTRILKGDYQDNKIFEKLWKTLEAGKDWHGEFHNKKKNGKLYWESASISPIFNEKRKKINYVKVAEDITEKKKIEEELQKMSKLKSIGTLAGGIAHDFNNILTGIYGNISLAKMEISEEHPGYRYLNETERSINRATKLTKQLLTFSKGGSPITKDVDLAKLIKETITFDLSGSNVKPVFNFADNLIRAKIDEGQIQQVFSNLAINADQASPEGGHLYISVENLLLQENDIYNLKPGKYLKTTIQDEGTGIEKKYLNKVFDPYFTTKQSGSGLGLATTYSIIQKHNGHLEIESEIGTGTTFTIYLPGMISQISKEEKITQAASPEMNKSAKILIMDDEEVIRALSSEMLKLMGYQTDTVLDGSQAIEKYKTSIESGDPYDLIIMDLTIPGGMGGEETIKHILKINPDVKVIVSSGYSSDALMGDFHKKGFKGVVAKPYTFNELKETLHRVLFC